MTPDERKKSPQAAREVLENLLRDRPSREEILGHFSDAIRWADKLDPDGWSVTLKTNGRVSLDVGRHLALMISLRCLETTLIKHSCPIEIKRINGVAPQGFESGYLPDCEVCKIDALNFPKARPLIAGPSRKLVEFAANERKSAYWRGDHSSGVLLYLDEIFEKLHGPGYEKLPHPSHSPLDAESKSGSKPADHAQGEAGISHDVDAGAPAKGSERIQQGVLRDFPPGQPPVDSPHLTADDDVANAQGQLASVEETTRTALIEARRGQGKYRQDLIKVWERCSVTRCAHVALLRASHIKPWRESTNSERLNLYNGLLLAPNLDEAFDRGLISFADDGGILISSCLSTETCSLLGIGKELRVAPVHQANRPFLAFHRERHGFGS
jgi:hypothetical protein